MLLVLLVVLMWAGQYNFMTAGFVGRGNDHCHRPLMDVIWLRARVMDRSLRRSGAPLADPKHIPTFVTPERGHQGKDQHRAENN